MRLLQVRFKNLNSLVGEWNIDLAHPAFTSEGIFAIIGPTGAGKTTILDAICLALYGRTPRLNKISKSANDLMSRQTGECFAEVAFETQKGRYRCHWSQRRARKKPDGELQSPKHELSNADTGELFESNIRGVADCIELATGMDFDRFTRSMLLAQGGFAAFLQADANERAPILEQITGTEIYSTISIRVHEQQRAECKKLEILQAEIAGIVILEPQQEQEIEQTLALKKQEDTELTAQLATMAEAITWLTTIHSLKKDMIHLVDEANALQHCLQDFEPLRDKWIQSVKAASLDGAYATVTMLQKQQLDNQQALKQQEDVLPSLELTAQQHAHELILAEQMIVEAKEALKAQTPILQSMRSLDQRLIEQKKMLSEAECDYKKAMLVIGVDEKNQQRAEEKYADISKTLEQVNLYFTKHSQDEWLISGLTGIEEQLSNFRSKQNDSIAKKMDEKKAINAYEQAKIYLHNCHAERVMQAQQLMEASNQLQQEKDVLDQLLAGRLLREYRADKETLLRELVLLKKIAELEEHRLRLEDGKPCPLCGAKEHPFAEENTPTPDAIEHQIAALAERIYRIEEQEKVISRLQSIESDNRNHLIVAEKQELVADNDKKIAEKTLVDIKNDLDSLQKTLSEHQQSLLVKLVPLGITSLSYQELSDLPSVLNARLTAWQNKLIEKRDIEKQIASLDDEIKHGIAVMAIQRMALAEKQLRLDTLNQSYCAELNERQANYGNKDPDQEEALLQEAIVKAENTEKQARNQCYQSKQQWHIAQTNRQAIQQRIHQQAPELKQLETDFFIDIRSLGFVNQEQFIAARLSSVERDKLATQAKHLDERQTEFNARQQDRQKRLADEMAKQITDSCLEELEPQYKTAEQSLKTLRESIHHLAYTLGDNIAAKEIIKEKQTVISAQKKECQRWSNLHELIGSADGKKFRNFAQGLTFEMMIAYANQQLQKMTDRYLLLHDDTRPLELNVVDNYQAGEIRSTKNLSGGEGFIVSLSLALGLSQMASKKVRVDSLFLDEGFGTLDDEALDVALDTLTGLQQDGKLIGIISHVQALKERINTQIQVIPQTGGRSQIHGPGCRLVTL